MSKNIAFLKHTMTYGAIMGGILSVLLAISSFIFQSRSGGLLDFLAIIAVIYIGTKKYRDELNNGFIRYSESLKTGIYISLFGGLIYGIALVFTLRLNNDFAKEIIAAMQDQLLNNQLSEEEVEMATKMLFKPMTLAIYFSFIFAIVGLILSLFISIFLRKEKTPFDTDPENFNDISDSQKINELNN
ncbi:DUF4199 domain-containing protein [Bacteroidales bacterium]|nr:DUF4199 domain-containing protein [Bacteroidales bacterium]